VHFKNRIVDAGCRLNDETINIKKNFAAENVLTRE
jgi:hypothetical protein